MTRNESRSKTPVFGNDQPFVKDHGDSRYVRVDQIRSRNCIYPVHGSQVKKREEYLKGVGPQASFRFACVIKWGLNSICGAPKPNSRATPCLGSMLICRGVASDDGLTKASLPRAFVGTADFCHATVAQFLKFLCLVGVGY